MESTEPLRMTPQAALANAIEVIGTQLAMANLLGITQGAVSKWLKEGKHLPAEHVLKVEAATGISRHDLRPDLYPRETSTPGHSDTTERVAA